MDHSMKFRFVDRGGQLRGDLDDDLGDVLVRYFAARSRMDENDAELALEVFDDMKSLEYWLICRCRRDASRRPLLGAVDPATLRRLPTPRDAHSESCPFQQRRGHGETVVDPSRVHERNGGLTIFPAFVQPRGNEAIRGGSSNRRRTLPRISNVLFQSLDAAEVNVLRHDEYPGDRDDSKRVYGAARTLPLVVGNVPLALSEALVTLSERDNLGKVIMLRRRLEAAEGWPAGSRAQGYACCVVESVDFNRDRERYELIRRSSNYPLFVEARPHVFAEGIRTNRRAPFIAIVGYSKPQRHAAEVLGLRCFMQPCYDRNCWFPVDSRFERFTLETLLDWRRKTLPRNIRVDFRKPLFDSSVQVLNGQYGTHRPDFVATVMILGKPPFDVAIETMGIDEADYSDRKERTHPLMLQDHGLLVQHDLTSGRIASTDRFLSDLNGAVFHRIQPAYRSLSGRV
ncbi:hypothetical protein AB8A05_06120 [Tardiphaga sp. 538_B7_N1_4]|uniref:hypothetical protein n=1 Tax=Tardiphaga sp. 538_B7_N1_4 TaxID=3240778 RepID=UPI003F29015D